MNKKLLIVFLLLVIQSMFSVSYAKFYDEGNYLKHIAIDAVKYRTETELSLDTHYGYILYSDGIVEYFEGDTNDRKNVTLFQLPKAALQEIDEKISNGTYKRTSSRGSDGSYWEDSAVSEDGKKVGGGTSDVYLDIINLYRYYHQKMKFNDEVILNKQIKIKYNDKYQEFFNVNGNEVYPISYNGTTYLPIRAISSLFKIGIEWKGAENAIYLGHGDADSTCSREIKDTIFESNETINVILNSKIKIFYRNELQIFKDVNNTLVYPISYEGTTYLPVRAISNLFNAEINWIGEKNEVEINYDRYEGLNLYESIKINGMQGTFVNNAGETLNFAYGVIWQAQPPRNCTGTVINMNPTDIESFIPTNMVEFFKNNYYTCTFKGTSPTEQGKGDYVLEIKSNNNSGVIDYYKISDDNMKLISLNRGIDYDFIKISDNYTIENYLNDAFDQNSNINGTYEINGSKIHLLAMKNCAFGKNQAILYVPDGDSFASIYWKETFPSSKSPLFMNYLRNNTPFVREVKELYSNYRHYDYFKGIIINPFNGVQYMQIKDLSSEPELSNVKKDSDFSIEEQVEIIYKLVNN